ETNDHNEPDEKKSEETESPNTDETSAPAKMTPMKKTQKNISFSDVGLLYSKGVLSLQLDAIATIGPLQFELEGFAIHLDLTHVKGFDIAQIAKMQVSVSLNGLGLSYSRGDATIAGLL